MTTLVRNKWLKSLLFAIYALISLLTALSFKGDIGTYLLFSIIFYLFLSRRLTQNSSYFDLFIGLFFFLGFWVKLNYHVIIDDFAMGDPVGSFKFDHEHFNRLLIIISTGILGFIFSRELSAAVWKKLNLSLPRVSKPTLDAFEDFYRQHRLKILAFLLLFALGIAAINLLFSIYQRGIISQVSSSVLRSFFAISLLFGLSACFCVCLKYDSDKKESFFSTLICSLWEIFLSSISMFSRGFVLNGGSILLATFQQEISKPVLKFKRLFVIAFTFILMTGASVKIVTLARNYNFEPKAAVQESTKGGDEKPQAKFYQTVLILLVDRWVGLEGTMSAVGYEGDRKSVFKEIFQEKMSAGTSIYDKRIANSIYTQTSTVSNKLQFVSLPGFIGWISILDDLLIIFIACFIVGIVCNILEFSVQKLNQNLFLSSLFGQVLAYRVSHFGYLPQQSYKLVTGIALVSVAIFLTQHLVGLLYLKMIKNQREVTV